MELDQFGFGDIRLIEGERIDSALDLSGGDGSPDGPSVLLLTDTRVMHLRGRGKGHKALFASVQDVTAVEIVTQSEGRGAYVWAALAFVLAFLLLLVLDNLVFRYLGAAAAALMGIYLVVDRLTTPGKARVIFKIGASELRCDLDSEYAPTEVHTFINRLFQLKAGAGSDGDSRTDPFASR